MFRASGSVAAEPLRLAHPSSEGGPGDRSRDPVPRATPALPRRAACGPAALGPGSVGENWTLSDGAEADVCIGDIYAVGTARVQVSGPRFPCWKQERKLGLPGFLQHTKETRRTGFYLRVLTPGTVQAGDPWRPEARPYPDVTVHRINATTHGTPDPALIARALTLPELAPGWKRILESTQNRAART